MEGSASDYSTKDSARLLHLLEIAGCPEKFGDSSGIGNAGASSGVDAGAPGQRAVFAGGSIRLKSWLLLLLSLKGI